jgi:hypothetical protein
VVQHNPPCGRITSEIFNVSELNILFILLTEFFIFSQIIAIVISCEKYLRFKPKISHYTMIITPASYVASFELVLNLINFLQANPKGLAQVVRALVLVAFSSS